MLQHQEQQVELNSTLTPLLPNQKSELISESDSNKGVIASQEKAITEFDELLAYLKAETEKVKRQKKILNYTIWSVCGIGIGATLFAGILRGDWDMTSLISMSGLAGASATIALSDNGKKLARQLVRFDDVRMVGVFAEVLEAADKQIVALAETKLTELLPRLQASDAHLLNPEQRSILNKSLIQAESGFVKAILKAYEQIGDSTAIPFVEKLTRGEGKAGGDAEVVAAANACLPFLIQRAKQQEQSQTLLRASEGNAAAPENLLRPANATIETQPDTLLRPVQQ